MNPIIQSFLEADERASLAKLLEYYKEELEWDTIQVVPIEPFNIKDFITRHPIYTVDSIINPNKEAKVFEVYSQDIALDFLKRIQNLNQNKKLVRNEKLDLIYSCLSLAIDYEHKYDVENSFKLLYDFKWEIQDENGYFTSITLTYLKFSEEQLASIRKELFLRRNFFRWMKEHLHATLNYISSLELTDAPIKWKSTDGSNLKIAELLYALKRSDLFDVDKASFTVLEKYLAALFDLQNPNWRQLESDIRQRSGRGGTKWQFLKQLMGTEI